MYGGTKLRKCSRGAKKIGINPQKKKKKIGGEGCVCVCREKKSLVYRYVIYEKICIDNIIVLCWSLAVVGTRFAVQGYFCGE